MRAVIGHWRSLGIFCGNHLDDMWIMHPNREILLNIRNLIILPDLMKYGFVLAKKSQLEPTQKAKFYGLILNT
ncbi:6347_t:CDS:1, partial [Acaulospora morrowiae]